MSSYIQTIGWKQNYFLYKQEDMSLSPQNPHKKFKCIAQAFVIYQENTLNFTGRLAPGLLAYKTEINRDPASNKMESKDWNSTLWPSD